ncbi:catechol 2,3-dioxygenase [Chryseomicrobium aureum]|uniref:VOC family protein n=1 Tax=Chryseomicrobium aureum TaxID=1441723 RepID=UPI001957043A|nr:VOC family protein [Chryseomicrobium aureum]MBM7707139.1 catechol 2,3-dioxygenase [Chryseomicrobium aureum]
MNFHQKPTTFVASVAINVTDLKRSLDFYTQVIGFQIASQTESDATLTTNGRDVLLTLVQPERVTPKQPRTTGLYHFAILLPTRQSLASIVPHLVNQGVQLGSSDHLVSEALYFADPDGNGIEIYRDRLPEEWTWQGDSVEMTVDPLNFEDLLTKETVEEWTGLPSDTVMGHIHLHVDDIGRAEAFYTQGLDFEVVTRYGHQALFISDNRYHHHIGLNVWNGVGAPQPAKHSAGLVHYTLDVQDADKQQQLAERLQAFGARVDWNENILITADAAGNEIHIVY